MISAQEKVSKTESRLKRLSDSFRELSSYGADAEEIAESLLSLRDVNRQALLDIGQLILLRAVRVKLEVFKLISELAEMDLIEETEATFEEIEQFYADLEREWAKRSCSQGEGRPQLIDDITPMPAEPEPPDVFDLFGVDDPRLFRTIQGFFDDVIGGVVPVQIPQELLELTQTIDIGKLQDEISARIERGATVKTLSEGFDFGSHGRTIGLVFSCCLFLDMQGKIRLVQSRDDVSVLPVNSSLSWH
jgi:hypothetical protein